MSPVRPLSASRIVGREQELAAVRSLLADGSGVLLVSGEAGIGKSRLVREATAHAATLGSDVLHGSCFDGDQAVPYAPFLDLMRGYVTVNPEGARAQLASTAPGFLRLLRELAPLPGSVDFTREPEQEQRRIFQEMRALLAGLVMERSLLVVVEDIHWSDDTSLELFLLLVRRMPSPRITFMLTYRSDEPSAGLNRFLAEVDRSRGASELVLRPLTTAETASMLRAILDLPRPPGAAFVHALHGLTGGNPFFVEEVLRSLVAEGAIHPTDDGWQRRRIDQLRVPRSVAEAVQRRVALLSTATRDVLTLAAVVGRRVDLGLLQALTGLDDDALLPAMKELIAAHLLIEVSDELFAFRHALIRQAIYAQLLTRERRALHARVALAIDNWQTGQADGVLETLAYHAFEAGQWERARQLCQTAGDRARSLYASQAAAEHYTRALEASTKIDSTADLKLLLSRAQAFDAAGDFSAAHADYEAALGAADVTGDSVTALSSLLLLGLLWSGRDYDQAHTWLLRAVDLARTMDDPTALANALNRLGNWHANHEDIEDALRCHDEALALFEHLGHHRGLAQALDLIAMARALAGGLLGAQDAARRAADLLTMLDDRQGLAGVLILTTLPPAVF